MGRVAGRPTVTRWIASRTLPPHRAIAASRRSAASLPARHAAKHPLGIRGIASELGEPLPERSIA